MAEWSPLDLSPSGWWDASDASTLYDAVSGGSNTTAGDTVLRWEDKSGNGLHMTVAANGPTHRDDGIFGNTILEFNGTNDYLEFPTPADIESNDDKTIVFVTRTQTGGTYGFSLSTRHNDGSVNNSSRGYQFRIQDDDLLMTYLGGGNAYVQPAIPYLGIHHIYVVTTTAADAVTPPDVIFYRSGNQLTLTTDTIAYNPAGSTELAGGSTALCRVNAVYASCLLCEVAIFNSVLSTADRQKLEGYLAYKWADTLVAGHPYKYKHQYGVPSGAGAARGIR